MAPRFDENQSTVGQLTIGVVGAGAASTALLHELLARVGHARPRIVVVDDAGSRGAGTVYGDDLDCALVNRQAQHMSVLNDDPDDFVRWAQEHWLGDPQTVYYPRSFFRRYLEDRFTQVCDGWLAAEAPLEMVAGRVHSIRQDDERVVLATTRGEIVVDFAVLCTGHGSPSAEQYERDTETLAPYPLRDLVERVDGCGRVAIRGSGLTAIDCALSILDSCPTTAVELVSRTGVLPDTRADFPEDLELTVPPRSNPAGATLAQLSQRFRAELNAYSVSEADLAGYVARIHGGVNTILHDIPHSPAEARIQNLSVSIANRDLPAYWFGFSALDRQSFLSRYYRLLQVITAPIPQSTARRLRIALTDGQLRSRTGTLARADGTWHLAGERGTYDMVIDGTGTATNAGQTAFEEQLARSGIVRLGEFGGIDVDATCRASARPGAPTRLYAIGYATRGSFLYASSLYQSALNARSVAQDLAARLQLGVHGHGAHHGSPLEVVS